ncbi:N-acetylmuramoyl-L-alanine amidase family protein [Pseudomonas syringae]|uniref:N-acetylmuramoyl-L-alanine amidase family protein n=2 Tax=Pseudomonas syringae TaxID=317 RepID=UPI000408E99A|nr:N-acetylmuramoyl-L-alanine amidase [Pseudomonas syringae]KTB95719.1 cell wall hydrolase [Pseudomonas syringae ICMP 11292]
MDGALSTNTVGKNKMLKVLTSRIIPFAFVLCASPCYADWVIVDAGHTRAHPGATGASGRVEHLYNLDLSSAVARNLQAGGDRVTRTGADNLDIALADRPNAEPGANLFVSIHHDSMQQSWIDAGRRREFKGYSIFVSTLNPHYQQSLACAKAIGEKLLAAGETPSLYHVTPIKGENRPFIDQRLGIHRFDDLIVLKTAPMPAVLIEAGVIANPDEEPRLQDPATIAKIAKAISQGVMACQP